MTSTYRVTLRLRTASVTLGLRTASVTLGLRTASVTLGLRTARVTLRFRNAKATLRLRIAIYEESKVSLARKPGVGGAGDCGATHKLSKNWLDTATMKSDAELVVPQAPSPGVKEVTSPTLDPRGIIAAVLARVVKSASKVMGVYLSILGDI